MGKHDENHFKIGGTSVHLQLSAHLMLYMVGFPHFHIHCIPLHPHHLSTFSRHSCEMLGLIIPICEPHSWGCTNKFKGKWETSLNCSVQWTHYTYIYIIGDSSKLSHYIPIKRLVWPPISPIMSYLVSPNFQVTFWFMGPFGNPRGPLDGPLCWKKRWSWYSHIGNQNDLT